MGITLVGIKRRSELTEWDNRYHMTNVQAFKEFLDKVRVEIPYLNIIRTGGTSAYFYYEDDAVTAGYVTFGDMRRTIKTVLKPLYHVVSHTIKNPKYADHNDLHHSKSSANPDKAITLLKTHMRRPSLEHVVAVTKDIFCEPARIGDQVRSKSLADALNALGVRSSETPAFYALEQLRGLALLPQDTQATLDKAVNLKAEIAASSLANLNVVAVQLRGMGEDVTAQYGKMTPTALSYWYGAMDNPFHDGKYMSAVSDLPEEIANRMAVLSIVDDSQYVPEVGVRIGERLFYVVL